MQIQLALSKTSSTGNKFTEYDKKIRGTQHANQHSSQAIQAVRTAGDMQAHFHSAHVS